MKNKNKMSSNVKNFDRYFSLKLIKRENSIKKQKPPLEKVKSISRSDDDLIDNEVDEIDRNEEARLAEEALAANLKLIKKQKARFLRLQKILSRNVVLIPLCAIFSVLTAISIFGATLTDHYEFITYDVNSLKHQINIENNNSLAQINAITNLNLTLSDAININKKLIDDLNKNLDDSNNNNNNNKKPNTNINNNQKLFSITPPAKTQNQDNDVSSSQFSNSFLRKPPKTTRLPIPFNLERLQYIQFYELNEESKDYFIVTRRNFYSSDNSSLRTNIIYETYSGVWRTCNYLSDESKEFLNVEKCTFYKTANIELDEISADISQTTDPGRDLVRMHNAAACCTIVAYFLLIFSWITGITAAVTKKVPVTLATCVLNMLIAVFLALLLAIFHRKIVAEEKKIDCYDLKIVFNIVCSSRAVKFGYSLGLTWIAFIFATTSGICWFHITKMQKLLFTHGFNYS